MNKELDAIIPITIELDNQSLEDVIEDIRIENKRYGFKKFALAFPGGGWRYASPPPLELYIEKAEFFNKVTEAVSPLGVECGWWNTLTLKSGTTEDTVRPVKADGSKHGFGTCSLDPLFTKRFCEKVATFAALAHPKFIIFEDDYSVTAATFSHGCFCELHLAEFAKREGKAYTREELCEIFARDDNESNALLRRYRDMSRDSLVKLSTSVREAVDVNTPEIPIYYMQPGYSQVDGDSVFEVAKALAGKNHKPLSRICGTFYGEADIKRIPTILYFPLYYKQHAPKDFICYHETDTFPHTRFFKGSNEMKAIAGSVYSYGFEGSIFIDEQILDNPTEETAYGSMYSRQRKRFNAAYSIAKKCTVKGAEIDFDPFWNTRYINLQRPMWLETLNAFGIPFTSQKSNLIFWDKINAKRSPETEVMRVLSKTVFLDCEAAEELIKRGYGKYLGVEVEEKIAVDGHQFDLGEREIICEGYAKTSKGRNMPSAHMLSVSNGFAKELKPIDSKTEVITKVYDFQMNYRTDMMTRFKNTLGGTVIVLGISVERNISQSLHNYRRQILFHDLMLDAADEIAFVRNDPRVYLIMNEADGKEDFIGMLTATNLVTDPLDSLKIHLPPKWKNKEYFIADADGNWISADVNKTEDGITVNERFDYLDPVYILVK